MNHLQHAIDALPIYHLRGKPLASLKLNQVAEIAAYYRRKGNAFRAWQFTQYMRGMVMNFDAQWQTRDNGFTLGASHYLKRRYADSQRLFYGVSLEG
jgi:hypothetical protein